MTQIVEKEVVNFGVMKELNHRLKIFGRLGRINYIFQEVYSIWKLN